MKGSSAVPPPLSSSPILASASPSSKRNNTPTGSSTGSNVENSSPGGMEHGGSDNYFVTTTNKTKSSSSSRKTSFRTNPESTTTMTATSRTVARLSTETMPLHDSTFNTTATASPLPSAATTTSINSTIVGATTASASGGGSSKRVRQTISGSDAAVTATATTSSKSPFPATATTTATGAGSPLAITGGASDLLSSANSNINNNSMSATIVEKGGRTVPNSNNLMMNASNPVSSSNKEVISSSIATPTAAVAAVATASPNSAAGNTRMLRTQQQQSHVILTSSSSAAAPAVMAGLSQQQQPHVPLRERRDSHSVTSQLSASDAWQWQENNDPDDQEQALFEQRLCDDIYGVAVRKINQNGKSSLRYVKCCAVDASELEDYYHGGVGGGGSGHHSSSNRSVSSRSWASRNGFSRFLNSGGGGGGTSSSNNSHADPREFDAHRNLIPGKKINVLTWGKKKDVKIPLDRFVAVRKGKTTDRTKRNSCPASRILSLITADEAHGSSAMTTTTLDIEAPTKLDRDKFARAFARFLNIPLLENDQQHMTTVDMRSVRSDMTPTSFHKDMRVQSSSQQMSGAGFMHDTANSSVPDIAMTTTNSYTTNGSSRKHAPMPVVTTSGIGSETGVGGGLPPSKASSRIFKTRKNGGGGSTNNDRNVLASQNPSNPNSFDKSDHQGSSMHSSSLLNNHTIGTGNSSSFGHARFAQQPQQTPTKEATLEIPISTPKPTANPAITAALETPAGDDAGSVVSSITGAGFDQDLVEELHLALEKMKVELEESRAEAARAVKVAEQAIQSAENSNSKDWNSTVTHKAAEAAAAAQKKSAEAMARARVAEERLEAERKNAMLWKKQLEDAEEQVGHWQTRAAAAEVQRYAVAESLEGERKKNAQLLAAANGHHTTSKEHKSSQEPFDPFGNSVGESVPTDDEVDRLRSKLAMESARRRKLLDALQDLRGSVRVYCRPHSISPEFPNQKSTIAMASSEVLMLDRSSSTAEESTGPLSFEFDGILSSDLDQHEVYAEFEAICASVVEGYKICIMSYGQADAGKTYTMLGKVEHNKDHSVSIMEHGIHLRAMKQLFSVLEHRRDRYHDIVTMNLIEVHDERLADLLAGTPYGESQGRVEGSRKSFSRKSENRSDEGSSYQGTSITSNKPKLEIKTNRDGETVVFGVLSVEVSSFDDIYQIWTQSLAARSKRLAEQDLDSREYEMCSHVIASLKIFSKNLSTGVITCGKMQFVDFASSDVTSRRRSDDTWKYVNKSLNTVSEVVRARSQYQRSVPYRNSTITHILSDSLEADTKVVLIACVSPEEKEIQNTTCTLRFAQDMRKVVVGKATRHVSASST